MTAQRTQGSLVKRFSMASVVALSVFIRPAEAEPATLRIMTFNVADVRAEQVADPGHARLRAIAAVLQQVRPDILLLNEIQHDEDGATAERFARDFLAVAQRSDGTALEPLAMRVFTAPCNTGVHSGFDLDRNGNVDPRAGGRDFAGDCWGYGEFPGQYGMALLVREGLEIRCDAARTFQRLRWADMPGALLPVDPGAGEPW